MNSDSNADTSKDRESAPETTATPEGDAAESSRGVAAIIERFGGIRPMASKLNLAVSTVQGWKERDTIPVSRQDQIIEISDQLGLGLTRQDFRGLSPEGARQALEGETDDGSGVGGGEHVPEVVKVSDTDAAGEAGNDSAAEGAPTPIVVRKGGKAAMGVALLALLCGVGALTQPLWFGAVKPHLPAALVPDAEGGASSMAVSQFERRLQALETAPPPEMPKPPSAAEVSASVIKQLERGAVGQVEGRIAKLEEQVAALRNAASALPREGESQDPATISALTSAISGLAARMDGVEDTIDAMEATAQAGETEADNASAEAAAAASEAAEAQRAALEQRIADLSDALNTLQENTQKERERLAALETALQEDTSALKENTAQGLDKLEEQIKGLEQLVRVQNRSDRLTSLEEQQRKLAVDLAALEVAANSGMSKDALFLLAVGQLRTAMDAGRAFAQELESVVVMLPEADPLRERLNTVRPDAAKGVPSLLQLRERFPGVARSVVQVAAVPEDGTLVDQAMGRMEELVTIRRVGPGVTGSSPEALVGRAEARLAEGDLAGAVELVSQLQGQAGKMAEDWLNKARATLEAQALAADLTNAALRRVAGGGSAKQ